MSWGKVICSPRGKILLPLIVLIFVLISPFFPPPSPAPPSPSLLPIREPSGEPPQEFLTVNLAVPAPVPTPVPHPSSPPRFPFRFPFIFSPFQAPPIGWKPRYDGILSHLWPSVGADLKDQEWVPSVRPILLPNGVPRVVPILHTHGFCTVSGTCFWEKKVSGNDACARFPEHGILFGCCRW